MHVLFFMLKDEPGASWNRRKSLTVTRSHGHKNSHQYPIILQLWTGCTVTKGYNYKCRGPQKMWNETVYKVAQCDIEPITDVLCSHPAEVPGGPSAQRQVCRRVLVWEGNRVHLYSLRHRRIWGARQYRHSESLFFPFFFLSTCPVTSVLVWSVRNWKTLILDKFTATQLNSFCFAIIFIYVMDFLIDFLILFGGGCGTW